MAKKNKTTQEILKELQNNPSYQNKLDKKKQERTAILNSIEQEERLISNKLNEVGINVNSIYDLVNSKQTYQESIPVLIDLLQNNKLKQPPIIEGVVRALAIKEASGIANKTLIDLYFNTIESNPPYLWAIGNTINVIFTDDDVDDIIKIVSSSENGISRQFFVSALGKSQSKKAENAVIKLLNDNQVRLHAIGALGDMKSEKAKAAITKCTNNSNKAIKKEALQALKKINS